MEPELPLQCSMQLSQSDTSCRLKTYLSTLCFLFRATKSNCKYRSIPSYIPYTNRYKYGIQNSNHVKEKTYPWSNSIPSTMRRLFLPQFHFLILANSLPLLKSVRGHFSCYIIISCPNNSNICKVLTLKPTIIRSLKLKLFFLLVIVERWQIVSPTSISVLKQPFW